MKLPQERPDIRPEGRAPIHVRKFLAQLGGFNPYGEPNLRIALAQEILIYRGAEWHDWPDNTSLEDQGGLQFSEKTKIVRHTVRGAAGESLAMDVEVPEELYVSQQKPTRVVKEMRWIERYPDLTGWLLQHWDPPTKYGSKQWWEDRKVPGTDLQALGPFPERGDYEPLIAWIDFSDPSFPHIRQTWNEILPFARIEEGYGQWMQNREQMLSGNADWRRLTRMNEWKAQEEAKAKRDRDKLKAILKDQTAPIFSSSLEAGRIREQWANSARAKGVEIGHVGN